MLDFGEVPTGGRGFRLHRFEDNSEMRILASMTEAELVDARIVGSSGLFAGLLPVVYYEASAP